MWRAVGATWGLSRKLTWSTCHFAVEAERLPACSFGFLWNRVGGPQDGEGCCPLSRLDFLGQNLVYGNQVDFTYMVFCQESKASVNKQWLLLTLISETITFGISLTICSIMARHISVRIPCHRENWALAKKTRKIWTLGQLQGWVQTFYQTVEWLIFYFCFPEEYRLRWH